MESIIRLQCNNSLYIDMLNPNTTYILQESLLSGFVNKDTEDNKFVSLLEFNIENIKINKINKAKLCVFIKQLKSKDNDAINLMLGYSNIENINMMNWSNYSENTHINELLVVVNSDLVGRYIEIDITNIIKKNNKGKNLVISLECNDSSFTNIMQLTSDSSINPPYLDLAMYENTINSDETEEVINLDNLEIGDENKDNDNNLVNNFKDEITRVLKTIEVMNKRLDFIDDIQAKESINNEEYFTRVLMNNQKEIVDNVQENKQLLNLNENVLCELEKLKGKIDTIENSISSLNEKIALIEEKLEENNNQLMINNEKMEMFLKSIIIETF